MYYQLPLILTAMLHADLLNEFANDAELTQKSDNYTVIASLKSEPISKLINRILGLWLLKSSRLKIVSNSVFENTCF